MSAFDEVKRLFDGLVGKRLTVGILRKPRKLVEWYESGWEAGYFVFVFDDGKKHAFSLYSEIRVREPEQVKGA